MVAIIMARPIVKASWAAKITGSRASDSRSGIRATNRTARRMARLIAKLTNWARTDAMGSASIGNRTLVIRLALLVKAVVAEPMEFAKKTHASSPTKTSAQ